MPYSLFCFRIKFFHIFIFAMAAFSLGAHSAEWRDCEKAKLRALQLQQHVDEHKTAKRKKQHRVDQHQSVEEIDTWLWKNCREYSYELRQLEQERM